MGLFSRFRKEDVIDYTDYQHRLPKKSSSAGFASSQILKDNSVQQSKSSSESSPAGFFGFLGNLASSETNPSSSSSAPLSIEDKKTEKHLTSLTNRYEELSTQLYRMQQRIEVLEQKLKTGRGY